MTKREPRATLLVFTRGVDADRRLRRFLPVSLGSREGELRQRCLDLAFEAGRANGCELLVSSPVDLDLPEDVRAIGQSGNCFWQRLARAEAQAVSRQQGPNVIVAADVPDLRPGHVGAALRTLHGDPDAVVIGPSPDGGLYLIASRRPLGSLLAEVPWCRRDTRSRLVSSLRRAGLQVIFLEPLRDLDHRAAFDAWMAGPLSRSLRLSLWADGARSVVEGLAALLRPAPTLPSTIRLEPASALAGRGPPVLA